MTLVGSPESLSLLLRISSFCVSEVEETWTIRPPAIVTVAFSMKFPSPGSISFALMNFQGVWCGRSHGLSRYALGLESDDFVEVGVWFPAIATILIWKKIEH